MKLTDRSGIIEQLLDSAQRSAQLARIRATAAQMERGLELGGDRIGRGRSRRLVANLRARYP